ncbi:Ditrans,polycis-undecaprenyl-diphosphate synthase ((2E,6E)-farnesyl-diphosphate specific) [invertebrate metagenome]|uniref:Ditrans,polycis-undecaprenyl-diphosphate synthase ((2E,6E)-farnesyl-diphosphate specific) n=1 Tax=invertebrate metagenome TaxID=1711999 RepID=A0A2H9T4V8_9ZZZZ
MTVAGNSLQHVAIIMDGLTDRSVSQQFTEESVLYASVESALVAINTCNELGIKILTLVAVDDAAGSIPLFVQTLCERIKHFSQHSFTVKVIGESYPFTEKVMSSENKVSHHRDNEIPFMLVIANRYSCKQDILQAVRKIAEQLQVEEIASVNEACIDHYLSTDGLPAPDLLIRTGGKKQIGAFLLWQCAYSEFYFTETSWFHFRREHLLLALQDFTSRQRRFGKTSEQVEAEL